MHRYHSWPETHGQTVGLERRTYTPGRAGGTTETEAATAHAHERSTRNRGEARRKKP